MKTNLQKKSLCATRHERFIIAVIIVCALAGIFGNLCRAQDRAKITRNGNNFQAVKTTRTAHRDSTATPYTFTDGKGQVYKVYLSKSGKAFIPKTSAKTGKYYRQYKPEITEAIKNDK